LRRPISIPDALPLETRTRHARSRSIQALLIPEVLSRRIGESGVGQIEILHRPRRRVCGIMAFALAEKDQLETKPLTIRVCHITRVIPPFGAKVFVFEVVSGKLVTITRQRFAIREPTRQQGENKQRK